MIKQSDEFDDLPDPQDPADLPPSKSQRKREALQAIDLAKMLLQLSPAKRDRFELNSEITDALNLADDIRSNGAKKRQIQYIGKLLRSSPDYEAYWDKHENPQQLETARNQKPDRSDHLQMRDRLLEDLAGTMSDLRNQYPQANIQLIRQLINRIHKSADNDVSDSDKSQSKHMQALVKELIEGQAQ